MGLPELQKLLATTDRSNLLMLGILLILAGLLFKIAAVPFHVWTPDVYEGSPTPVTAFFSVGPKVAAYAILARIFYVAFPKFHADWGLVVALVAAATMVLGNVAALLQTNVKRLFAYSSIANAGYALLGVLGFSNEWGLWGILVYLLAYTFMNFGAFTLVILLESRGYAAGTVSDFNGLAKRNMPAAIVMLLFLLSLAGIPPTAGFIGKYYLFTAAMKAGYTWLAVLAVAMSAVSLFYYFRIAAAMFFSEGDGAKVESSYALTTVVAICAAGTLAIGVVPQPFLALLKHCVLRPEGARHGRSVAAGPHRGSHHGGPPFPARTGRGLPDRKVGRGSARDRAGAVLDRRGTRPRGGLRQPRAADVPGLAVSDMDLVIRRVKRRAFAIGAVGIVAGFAFGPRSGASLTICAAVVISSFLVLEKATERLVPGTGKAGFRTLLPLLLTTLASFAASGGGSLALEGLRSRRGGGRPFRRRSGGRPGTLQKVAFADGGLQAWLSIVRFSGTRSTRC